MTKNRLSEFLKEKRVQAGLSQGDVARIMGYSTPQFVSNWERGLSNPPIETLKQLAKIFSVSHDQIYQVLLKASMEQMEAELRQKFYKTERRSRKAAK